ncbi:response regulator [bacterium]|nr:response regulator [bacterium]
MKDHEKRILIIDPDERDRADLVAFLRKENYHVQSGKGLPDAVKKLFESDFNCLILDVNLPEIKGYEAVSIIKNIDPNIKIIMTTSENNRKLEAKVREQDIFYYFIKSFGKDELKLAIHNAFNQ